ncbi:MAG: hypothetical protein AB1510_00835 [Bacillota bacterium]
MSKIKGEQIVLAIVGLFLGGAFLIGYTQPLNISLYNYWLWFGLLITVFLMVGVYGIEAARYTSIRIAMRRGVLNPLRIYALLFAISFMLPDAYIRQHQYVVDYCRYETWKIFLIGIPFLLSFTLSVTICAFLIVSRKKP